MPIPSVQRVFWLVTIIATTGSSAFAQDTTGTPQMDAATVPVAEPRVDTRGADGEVTPYRPTEQEVDPALPEGMTLEQVLARAAQPPPDDFPAAVHDDRILAFLFWDQLEYRVDGKSDPDVLGFEANAWIGGDFNRLVLKPEGEVGFESERSLDTEIDILYSRLIAPFWSGQIGAQYAIEWTEDEGYSDRWSGAVAFQGLAPGKFEVDASVYVSEKGHATSELELEYDWRITQRLVAQPRTEIHVAFQSIPERNLGAGPTDVVAGLRLRYEIKREFAPYLGIRYQGRVFETADRTRAAGEDPRRFLVLGGLRLAFL